MSNPDHPITHVRIVGAGLIGTSIALALAQRGISLELDDEDSLTLELALDLLHPHLGDSKPDVVVIATPPRETFGALTKEFARNPEATFIDVGSVKYNLLLQVQALSELSKRFIGTHPMAGREVTGASSAQADLFNGRAWILTPTDRSSPDSVRLAEKFVELLGATAYFMSAEHHDELLSRISHLPQITSTALAASLEGSPDELTLAGQGLRDMTRIANSDGELWSQILIDNGRFVLQALDELSMKFEAIRKAVSEKDADAIQAIFRDGNVGRSRVSGKHGAQPRNYSHLLVVIKDEPGALSQLFIECAEINANIEDLSIEHSPGQLTGLITLAFSPEDAVRVKEHLINRDWKVHLR